MSNFMLIDGNNIGFAAQSGGNKLTVGNRDVRAIFGFIKTVRRLMAENPSYKPVVLWDGRAQWRIDLYPEYKGNRNKDAKGAELKKAWEDQKPDVKRFLRVLGVPQFIAPESEADDIAAAMSVNATKAKMNAILVTGDKDWVQLVNKHVLWLDPIRERHCAVANFAEFTGYATPRQFLEAKALTGDTSDNIKGVGGIGEKGAQDFLMHYGSVQAFFDLADSGDLWDGRYDKISKVLERFARNEVPPKCSLPMRDAYRRNMKLMNLMEPTVVGRVDRDNGELNETAFKAFCEEFAFFSIMRDLEIWLTPFRRHKR